MAFGAVRILDINGLSYLYTKLRNNIDEFQATSRSVIDAAAAAANTAADRANAVVDNANDTFATKEELKTSINKITSFEFSVVDKLPATGVKGTIYLVKNTGNQSSSDNIYDEYIWIESKYEKIGTTDINFSKYLTTDEINNTFLKKTDASTTYATKGEVTTVSNKVDANIASISSNSTAISNHSGNGTIHITANERNYWNGKADGSHSHSSIYASGVAAGTTGSDDQGRIVGASTSGNTGIFNGNGDAGGDSGVANLIIKSWFGVGFVDGCTGAGMTVGINCRTGNIKCNYINGGVPVTSSNVTSYAARPIQVGTSAPSSLARGQLYCVIE